MMKPTQIVLIHGGNQFASQEAYLLYLEQAELTLARLNSIDWKDRLAVELGSNYEVLQPSMPNKQNARYEEWRIWFKKVMDLVTAPDVVLVGHSLGGAFLAKFLSTEKLEVPVRAAVLVAAPFRRDSQDQDLRSFAPPEYLDAFDSQVGSITCFHSTDDPVVPFSELNEYAKRLPNADMVRLSNRGHFNEERFPELVEILVQGPATLEPRPTDEAIGF